MAPPKGSTSHLAKGGILKNGVRHFQAGGLNATQIQAGIDAGNSALGSFYSYGSAGEDGGYDCAGIWNYIEAAVAWGAAQTGKRWGTYDAAAGGGGSFTTPGALDGGANIGVDLSGWGGPDDTHMAGDVGGVSFESDGYNGVYNGYDSSAFGTQYTMGSATDMVSQLPAGESTDPSGNIAAEVADWWGCQTAPSYEAADPNYPVNPWDTGLPGMTEDYLTDVGQGTLQSTGSTTQDWIVAALNGLGMDASPEAIATIESLMMQESGGDPNAYNPSGASGLMQMMPDTFAAYSQGGDIWDPVSNIMASITYQMARYGYLVDTAPYAQGGFALGPHMGMVGEAGREAMVPLDNKRMMGELRHGLGMAGMTEQFELLAERIDNVAERVDHQTRVIPDGIAGGVKTRIEKDPAYGRAMNTQNERMARHQNLRGGR